MEPIVSRVFITGELRILTSDTQDNPNCAVFVSNIGPNAGENTIAEFFSFCGRIEALSL